MSSSDAISKLKKAQSAFKDGGIGTAKLKSAGAAIGKTGSKAATLGGGAAKGAPASLAVGKLSIPYMPLTGLGTGSIKVTSVGVANGSKLASILISGKGLSLGLGLGLGALGPALVAGTICAAGYCAFQRYGGSPKGKVASNLGGILTKFSALADSIYDAGQGTFIMQPGRPNAKAHQRLTESGDLGALFSKVASIVDAVYSSSANKIRKLISEPDDEAALAAELATEIAMAAKLLAEANEAEKRALVAGASAKQAAMLAAAAKRRAKAALDLQHQTEDKLAATRARKKRAAAEQGSE